MPAAAEKRSCESRKPLGPSSHPTTRGNTVFFFFLIGVQLIYNIVLFLGVQKRDSGIHIFVCLYILFWIPYHYRLLQDIKYSSL